MAIDTKAMRQLAENASIGLPSGNWYADRGKIRGIPGFDADFIAACSPAAIRALCDALDAQTGELALVRLYLQNITEPDCPENAEDNIGLLMQATRRVFDAQTAELEALRKAVRDLVDAANEMLYHRTCSWREDCNTDAGTRLVAARDGVAALLAATRESPAKKEKLCWCGCPYLNCGGRCGQE